MQRFRKERNSKVFLKRGLILCEGETEENYFNGLISKEEYRRKFSAIEVKIYKPKDHSPKGLVNEAKEKIKLAKKEKNPFDFAWVIFDRDGHQNIPQAFDNAKGFLPEIKIAFTVTCFEYFILLHFTNTTKAFNKCADTEKELKKYLPDYEKASNLFSILEKDMKKGLSNSEWCLKQCKCDLDLGKKPYELAVYSNIHELVNFLFSLIK